MASSWLLLLGSTGENDKNHALLHVKSLSACSVHFAVFITHILHILHFVLAHS